MAKTLLLLGGSAQQLIAIEAAKARGCRTVLCDYLEDNPGQYDVDVFYLTSTTDKESVLAIARSEQIDGVVAYSSDPAAPTAAFVADALGLPGVPCSTADSFCEKHRFRAFLSDHGFNVPFSLAISGHEGAESLVGLPFPLIIKPTDSSGSKGVTVVRHEDEVEEALAYARSFSRNNVIIAEEFVERDHPHVIEAEIFVINGKVVTWGLINSIRDADVNPLLPAAYSYPLALSPKRVRLVKDEVTRLVECSEVSDGAFNIEMIIDDRDRLFFLDAGPRNGGNMLPEFIGSIAGADLVGATIDIALGNPVDVSDIMLDGKEGGSWGLAVVHSPKRGSFEGVSYSAEAKRALRREVLFRNFGEEVRPFITCNDAIGLAFFGFADKESARMVMEDLSSHVKANLSSTPEIENSGSL